MTTWRLRKGSTRPQTFRWKDRSGPVDLTDMLVEARLVGWDGATVELSSAEGDSIQFWEQVGDTVGWFDVTLTQEQADLLRTEAPGRAYFTATFPDGIGQIHADYPLIVSLGGGIVG